MNLDNFWTELRRRRVVRVVVAYAVAVFIILQVASLTFEPLGLPAWAYKFILILCMAGFPVVAALAWAFDVKKGNASGETKNFEIIQGNPACHDRQYSSARSWFCTVEFLNKPNRDRSRWGGRWSHGSGSL